MKTAEEKAMGYTDNEFAILPKSMAKEDMRHRAQKDFEAGYNEAMRWRDPNIELPDYYKKLVVKYQRDDLKIDYACVSRLAIELPDYYKKLVVKYQRDDLKIDYACVSRLADDDGTYFFGDYHFDIAIDFDRVIGWRPIE